MSILVQGQESKPSLKINEVFIHKKNPKKNWAELKIESKLPTVIPLEYYISTSKKEYKLYPIRKNTKSRTKIKTHKPTFITSRTIGNINANQTLYLFSKTGSIPLDSFKTIPIDSSKYCTTIKDKRGRSKLTYAVTRKKSNLTLKNSHNKKTWIVNIGIGLGKGNFRSIENKYNTSYKKSWSIGLLRERSTLAKYVIIQYGLDFNFTQFGFDGHNIDTLSKSVNGVERITFRTKNTIGWRKNTRVSVPMLLSARVNNKIGLTIGTSIGIISNYIQYYKTTVEMRDGKTNNLIQTFIFEDEQPAEYANFIVGINLGATYYLNKQHSVEVKYVRYNEQFAFESATGKGNLVHYFQIGYGIRILNSRKSIPRYHLIDLVK